MDSIRRNALLKDRFAVGDRIGEGGHGNLHQATDFETGDTVVVKVFDSSVDRDTNFIAFFRQRAREAMQLQHPNVVRTVTYGLRDDTYYLVWEYVEGRNFFELMQEAKEPHPAPAVLEALFDCCRGLSYMHRRNVVHGRLKPSAVRVRPDGSALIGDIGPGHQIAATGLTMTNTVVASVSYLSPEQLNGERATVASDIYAFGLLLYEACTGRLPFVASNPVALAIEQLNSDPPSPRSLNPLLSPAIEAIILRCLAKEPEQRFSSIDQVGEELAVAARPESIKVTPLTDWSTTVEKIPDVRFQKMRQWMPKPLLRHRNGGSSGSDAHVVPQTQGWIGNVLQRLLTRRLRRAMSRR